MRTPKFSVKRGLGLALAAALAATGTLAVASNSDAASTPAASLTPATGAAAGGTVIDVKGKGLQDTTGTNLVLAVTFSATVCGGTVAGTAATSYNVVSATHAVVTSPALVAGTWYMCLWDAASGTSNPLGQGKFVTAAAPTATTLSPATANVATASVLGGTTVSVTGTNFDKAAKATIGGTAAKTTYVSATKLSVVLPAHAAATLLPVKVTTEYGSVNTTDTVSYVSVVSVSPAVGVLAAGGVVTLTGLGFNALTFGSATTNQVVVFVPAATTLTSGTTTIASLNPCTSLQVSSDTTLTCQAPVLTTGAYSVMIVARHATATAYGTSTTTVSRSATYTAAAL